MSIGKLLSYGAGMLLAATFSTNLIADAQIICDGCSDTQYKQQAKLAVGWGVHTVYVFDTERWKATKWSVEVEKEDGITYRWITAIPLDSYTESGFSKYREATQDLIININPIDFGIGWDPGPYDSAYEVVASPDAYNDIYAWYREQRNWVAYTMAWAQSLAVTLTTRIANAHPVLKFNFPDGSKITFKVVMLDFDDLSFKLEFKYAEDSNGDVIPQQAENYDPNGAVNAGIEQFYNNAGVQITPVDANGLAIPGGFIAGKCYEVSCEDNNGVYVCTAKVVPGTCYYR